MKIFNSKSGGTLILLIILIMFVGVTAIALISMFPSIIPLQEAREENLQVKFAAKAGILRAIDEIDETGRNLPNSLVGPYFTNNAEFDVGANAEYRVSANSMADKLMVDTNDVLKQPGTNQLRGLKLYKITKGDPITIENMIFEWEVSPARKLDKLVYVSQGGNQTRCNVNHPNPAVSPAYVDCVASSGVVGITLFDYGSSGPFIYEVDRITFGGGISGMDFCDITFEMSDGSSKKIRIYQDTLIDDDVNDVENDQAQITLTATGRDKINIGNFFTYEVVYDVSKEEIVSYTDISASCNLFVGC